MRECLAISDSLLLLIGDLVSWAERRRLRRAGAWGDGAAPRSFLWFSVLPLSACSRTGPGIPRRGGPAAPGHEQKRTHSEYTRFGGVKCRNGEKSRLHRLQAGWRGMSRCSCCSPYPNAAGPVCPNARRKQRTTARAPPATQPCPEETAEGEDEDEDEDSKRPLPLPRAGHLQCPVPGRENLRAVRRSLWLAVQNRRISTRLLRSGQVFCGSPFRWCLSAPRPPQSRAARNISAGRAIHKLSGRGRGAKQRWIEARDNLAPAG